MNLGSDEVAVRATEFLNFEPSWNSVIHPFERGVETLSPIHQTDVGKFLATYFALDSILHLPHLSN